MYHLEMMKPMTRERERPLSGEQGLNHGDLLSIHAFMIANMTKTMAHDSLAFHSSNVALLSATNRGYNSRAILRERDIHSSPIPSTIDCFYFISSPQHLPRPPRHLFSSLFSLSLCKIMSHVNGSTKRE